MISKDNMDKADVMLAYINMTDDCSVKYILAEARYELVCKNSKIGSYSCSMRPPFSSNVSECDYCLEDELFELWKAGIHTISSCCGHGKVPPYIQVLKGDSVKKMEELGYVEIINNCCNTDNKAYRPKTYLPCFSPCCECESCVDDENYFAKKCIANDYDINLKWCFQPRRGADMRGDGKDA